VYSFDPESAQQLGPNLYRIPLQLQPALHLLPLSIYQSFFTASTSIPSSPGFQEPLLSQTESPSGLLIGTCGGVDQTSGVGWEGSTVDDKRFASISLL
jgi:hypothetical protein